MATFNPNPARTPDTPLGPLNDNQYTYSNFIYPMDLGAPNAGKDHYMVFHINESANTQFSTRSVNGAAPTDDAIINNNVAADARQNTFSQNQRPINRVATTIVLYMPQDIQAHYAADWSQTELGVASEVMALLKGTSTDWTNVFKSAGASIVKNVGEKVNSFTGTNVKDAASLAQRMVINNHQEVIFNGITFRTFNFNFRFTPESEDEAVNVDNIIRAFKFYSAPEILQGMAGRFWIYPGEFDIQYYANGKENLFLNKISTCAMTSMSVNYTPIGHWSAFRPYSGPGSSDGTLQGSPSVCTDMQLSFIELELMTKKRVLEGY